MAAPASSLALPQLSATHNPSTSPQVTVMAQRSPSPGTGPRGTGAGAFSAAGQADWAVALQALTPAFPGKDPNLSTVLTNTSHPPPPSKGDRGAFCDVSHPSTPRPTSPALWTAVCPVHPSSPEPSPPPQAPPHPQTLLQAHRVRRNTSLHCGFIPFLSNRSWIPLSINSEQIILGFMEQLSQKGP